MEALTMMERELLQAVSRLERETNEREALFASRLESLTQQVSGLTRVCDDLRKALETE